MTYYGPARDPPLGGSGRKTTTLVKDHKYFIPTKFHQNPSSGSGEEVENVKSLRRTDGRTDRRTDDGRCAMTIAHSSLRLRWAKKASHIYYQLYWLDRLHQPRPSTLKGKGVTYLLSALLVGPTASTSPEYTEKENVSHICSKLY